MSDNRKEIDLIIRAALQGGKTLEGVTKSIGDIEKALERQTAAAKKGEGSIDELRSTLLALQKVQEELKSQASLIDQFNRMATQIKKTEDRVASSSKTLDDYRAKLEKAGKATEYQNDKLAKLANSFERNQQTLAKQRSDQQAMAESLRQAGVAVDGLTDAESRLRQSAAQLGVTINRTQQAISTYADDVRKARDAQKAMADEAAFQKKLQEASQLAKATDYVRFWTEALNKADIAEQQIKVNAALRKAADEAVATARGYKTLGTAAKTLTASTGSLRAVVDGITDPSRQARSTLAGVEDQIRKIGSAVTAIRGPVENYRQQIQDLAKLQQSIATQASLVDSYQKQMVALRAARTEYASARAEVLQYAEALRNSSGANEQLSAKLRAAQQALASAQANLAQQIGKSRDLREAMRSAGIATNDLASAQTKLTTAAQSGVSALRTLEEKHRRYGEAVNNSRNAQDLFSESGRTTLSVMQRIRGQVFSMIAAYAGLYGAINGAQKSIDAFNAKQGIQNQLAISAGNDNAKIAEEYDYIRKQADRIGVSFEEAAKGYAKFSASAKLAGQSTQEIRYIFETFSEVGRVANLSTDQLDGVFKALGQIIDKGKIQAEELRGQLGDRLFGAFQIAAQALKEQYPNLDKAMKNGEVTADQLLKIAEKYRETVGPRLADATANLSANQARLNSALFDFKVLVAEQGFAEEYGKLVTSLTEFFKSDDGTKFAKTISDALSVAVQGLRLLVENAELVKEILIVGIFVFGAKSALTFGAALVSLPARFAAVTAAAGTATGAMRAMLVVFPLIAAAAAGWAIGAILREKFVEVRRAGIALVIGLDSAWTRLKYGTQILWEEIPAVFQDGLSTLGNMLTKGMRDLLSIFSAGARALGRTDLAESIDKAIGAIQFRTDRIGNASATLRKQMEADLKKIQDIGWDMWQEAENPGGTSAAKKAGVAASPTSKPSSSGKSSAVEEDEKAAEKRVKLREQLENELTAIEARIENNEKESLSRRLDAIDLTYQKLVTRIRKLGGAEAAELEARLLSDISRLKEQETKRFNEALLKEQMSLQTKLEELDAKAGRQQKTDIDARLAAVKLSYEDTYRQIDDFRQRLIADGRDTGTADLMKQRLDAGVVALQNLERQKYFEDAINAILEERKAKLDTIAVMEKNGLLTVTQARERAAEVVTQTQPKIEAVVAEGLKYVDTMVAAAEATGANVTALETLRAKLLEAQGSAKGLRTELFSAAQINEMLGGGMTLAFENAANAIGGAIAGVNSWKDAIHATRNAFIKFAADFLMEMGKMILKQTLLNSLQNSGGGGWMAGLFNGFFGGGGGGTVAGGWVGSPLFHTGGVVGRVRGPSKRVPASLFANAPRYHGGGLAGLAPGEYPAILKKNEEVLTQNDPRNVLNGGGATASQNIKIMNMIDSGSVVSEGLSSQEGEKAIFNFIRANRTGLKQILG